MDATHNKQSTINRKQKTGTNDFLSCGQLTFPFPTFRISVKILKLKRLNANFFQTK